MTLIFGHRGAKAYYAENTLSSFEHAIDMGADGIELDVHVSKDRKSVVAGKNVFIRGSISVVVV